MINIKVIVHINGSWITLSNKDTIDGMNYNVASPELFPNPKFVEIIHNDKKYYVNSIFIQYIPETSWKFGNEKII